MGVGLLCRLLTSAQSPGQLPDRALSVSSFRSCRAMTPACPGLVDQWPDWLSTDRSLSRSPRIRALTFAAQPHHLQWPLSHVASLSCASSPPAYALYDVLVHRLAVLLRASSRPLLTDQPLPFASSSRQINHRSTDGDSPTEDFHLIS